MDNKSIWLADINNQAVSISLIDLSAGSFTILAMGPQLTYDNSLESFVNAIDQSLSAAATQANIPAEEEPNTIALIIPPFWVGSDGKIVADKLKIFENLFRELQLKPMGFIANDEALVEDANQSDGFPASFVLVNLGLTEIVVSLTYLGKVIERITKPISDQFTPALLESTLQEFKTESTLPPQIILIGVFTEEIVESLENYTWIGKKNIETFLHFPDIKTYDQKEVVTIYTQAITSQFAAPTISPPDTGEPELTEVNATDMGFGTPENFTVPTQLPDIISAEEINLPLPIITTIPKKPFKINLPKFKLPPLSFHLPSTKIFLIPLVLSPLLFLIPFYFSQATITLFMTPYSFAKQVSVTFDPTVQTVDVNNKIIPINRKTFDINNSLSTPTTGQITTGEKARGEIIVYNKLDKSLNITKGAVLVDSQGNKYEVSSAVQIASSSSNLDLGVINLGQTKVMILAADIGPEYNLSKDAKLQFKDFPDTSVVAKVSESIAGGIKRQINAVSAADRQKLDQLLSQKISTDVDTRLNQEIVSTPGIIKDTVQIKKGRIEYNREIGEAGDELVATSVSTVYLFYLDNDKKTQMLTAFLSAEPGFNDSIINPNDFNLNIKSSKNSIDKIQGLLSINGQATPRLNLASTAKLLSGKSQASAQKIIKNNIPRVYNYQISTNFSFLKAINPLPFRLQNIKIEVK